MDLEGVKAIPTCGKDVVEVCRLAKAMQVPVSEMQQSYILFRDHAEPLAPGAELLRDGRLGQEQFAKLVRNNLISDSIILANRSIKRVFVAADANQDGALSFQEFVECMRVLSFDGAFSVTPEERKLRGMAKKYNLSPAELDRYKKMFDELDEDHSGKIENREFENLLYRCGNIPRGIGISASRRHSLWLLADPNLDGSIDFEEFLIFNLKYFAPGAKCLLG
jgi:Ca2+-binding EF-hand superfamily protein